MKKTEKTEKCELCEAMEERPTIRITRKKVITTIEYDGNTFRVCDICKEYLQGDPYLTGENEQTEIYYRRVNHARASSFRRGHGKRHQGNVGR